MKSKIAETRSFVIAILFLFTVLLNCIPGLETAVQAFPNNSKENSAGSDLPLAQTQNEGEQMESVAELQAADSSGLSFTVSFPWEQLTLESVDVEGKQYIKPSLTGWSESLTPGMPELPIAIEQIGVPLGAEVELQVIPGKQHMIHLEVPVLPVATQMDDWNSSTDLFENSSYKEPKLLYIEDSDVYYGQSLYPGVMAEITGDGYLRQQRVVGVSTYPVQYDPLNNQLIIYESMQVSVEFSGSFTQSQQTFSLDAPVFEDLLAGSLLNYESAKSFRSLTQSAFERLDSEGLSQSFVGAPIPWAPPDPGYRITVKEDGFYKITYAELSEGALGIPVDTLDPRTFQMFYLGNEIGIEVVGEGDGSFDPGDTILFFGEGIKSKYTEDNIYWLTYEQAGVVQGARVGTRDGTPGTASTPAYYFAQLHMEENNSYRSSMPFDDDEERWWWDYVFAPTYNSSWNHTFTLIDPFTGALDPGDVPAEISVSLIGWNNTYAINPDHHARIFINSTAIGDMLFDGQEWSVSTLQIPQGVLQNGSNSVEVRSIADTGATSDWFLIDYIHLDYPNRYSANTNELDFAYEASGTWQFSVDGFSSDQVKVYDITDPAGVVSIANISTTPSGGDYYVNFQDTVSELTRYWALTDTTHLSVVEIKLDSTSDLFSASNGADFIVITHETFWTQSVALSSYRSDTMRTITIDVQDIYDEFNYGIVGAKPIHDFLSYAYNTWGTPAPSYVVLVGDGHYDPKQYYGFGKTSFIPPYLLPVDPWMGETAADNRYVTIVGGDTLPDMMIGRLAVNNATEANIIVNKIIDYETNPIPGDWQQQILAVADDPDYAGDFPGMSDNLLDSYISAPYTSEKVYYLVTHSTSTAANQAILSGINSGKLIVNYMGHGGYTVWGNPALFTASNVSGLTNGGKLPVMLEMTCYSGSFHNPDIDAIAEVAPRASGKGTIANWASTGEGVASGHVYLDGGFFEAFFQDGLVALGDATMRGKFELWSTGGALDLLDTYILFGDPALEIVRPDGTNSPPAITEGSSVSVTMSEDGSPIPFSLTLNATDPDGDTITWSVSSQAQHGSATASGTGTSKVIGYSPAANYNGSDSFIIRVSDGSYTDEITVNVTLQAVNDPPVAVDDAISTEINTPVSRTANDLMFNDTDVDNTSAELSITGVSNPINGTVVMNSGTVTFTPTTDFTGMAGYDYTLSDGALTATGHVTVTVNFINTPPIAVDDAYVTAKNQVLTVSAPGVLGNDHDPNGTPITTYLVTNPDKGTLSLGENGAFIYTPKNNFVGTTSFTYMAYDGVNYSNEATVNITVLASVPQVSIPLYTGWNLVSFNLQPSSTAISDVLSSIEGNYTLVNAWDATTETWLLYDPAAPSYVSDLNALDHTMGFWVFMSAPDTFVVSGMPPTTTNINLRTGWNLVGYPSMDPVTLPGALSDNGVTDYSMVMAFHANETEPWKTYDPVAPSYANNLIEITPNWGYWINVSSDSTWTIAYDQP